VGGFGILIMSTGAIPAGGKAQAKDSVYPDDDAKTINKRLGQLWKEVTEEEKQVRGEKYTVRACHEYRRANLPLTIN